MPVGTRSVLSLLTNVGAGGQMPRQQGLSPTFSLEMMTVVLFG